MMSLGSASPTKNDLELAKRLQEEYDREVAAQLIEDETDSDRDGYSQSNAPLASHTQSSSSMALSPVDPSLELSDPNPDIRALFLQFNERFFWSTLSGIEVKWSPRMTLCAGLCVYEGRGGLCSVRLSQPLLKLRPRKDLVETLLHEMIHAYLFVTDNNKDHDGHGPEFQKHMTRINKDTGAHISIYHTFHDEVAAYQQHWWRCNGPCQNWKPYYGYVKRAMNRAPSARDFWWADHQAKCGGTYTKIKEPEGYGQKKSGKQKADDAKSSGRDIRSFIGKGNQLGSSQSAAGLSKTNSSKTVGTVKNPASIFGTGRSGNIQDSKSDPSKGKSVIMNGVLQRISSAKGSSLFTTISASVGSSTSSDKSLNSLNKQDNKIQNSFKEGASSTASKQNSESKLGAGKDSDLHGDDWPEEEDDSWVNDVDFDALVSENAAQLESKSKPRPSSSIEDPIDLTIEDVPSPPSDANNTEFKRIKVHMKGNFSKHLKQPKLFDKKTNRTSVLAKTKDGKPMFGPSFVSVCEEKSFRRNRRDKLKKPVPVPKVKKKYVFDDLDSDEGLWEEKKKENKSFSNVSSDDCAVGGECETVKKEKEQEVNGIPNEKEVRRNSSRNSVHDNSSSSSNSSPQSTLSSSKSFVPSQKHPSSVSEKSTDNSHSNAENSNWHVDNSHKNIDNRTDRSKGKWGYPSGSGKDISETQMKGATAFSGHGYKLGENEEGTSFLAVLRKNLAQNSKEVERTSIPTFKNSSSSGKSNQASTSKATSVSSPSVTSVKRKAHELSDDDETDLNESESRVNKRRASEYNINSEQTGASQQPSSNNDHVRQNPADNENSLVSCPVCCEKVMSENINAHLDLCLSGG